MDMLTSELAAARSSDANVASPPPPAPVPPNTPPSALALTPRAVKTDASPAANASAGSDVLPSSLSRAADEMYETVIGSRPREHGLSEVHSPAA